MATIQRMEMRMAQMEAQFTLKCALGLAFEENVANSG